MLLFYYFLVGSYFPTTDSLLTLLFECFYLSNFHFEWILFSARGSFFCYPLKAVCRGRPGAGFANELFGQCDFCKLAPFCKLRIHSPTLLISFCPSFGALGMMGDVGVTSPFRLSLWSALFPCLCIWMGISAILHHGRWRENGVSFVVRAGAANTEVGNT